MTFRPMTRLAVVLGLIATCSCAGFSSRQKTADPCDFGTRHLKQALGPEFGKIRRTETTDRPKQAVHTCALIYTRLAEEDIEDLPSGEDMLLTEVDERLALMLFPPRGAPQFRRIPSSSMAPGPVRLKLKKADMNGDAIPDFVIEESAPVKGSALGYRGLRIINGAASSGQIIFDYPLRLKTDEGLELTPRWSMELKNKQRSILYRGGGKTQTFTLDTKTGRFMPVKVVQPQSTPPKANTPPKAATPPKPTAPNKMSSAPSVK